jgi:hypothetical protein
MRGTPALMVPRVWYVGRASTRTQWGMHHVQHALQAMLWRVVLRPAIANVMPALRVSSLRRGVHVRLAKQARTVLLLDRPLVNRVQQVNTTRRKLPLRAHRVQRILCLLLVLIKRRIANATKATSDRTDKRAPHANRALTQARLAASRVPSVVLGTTRSVWQTPCAAPAHHLHLQQRKRPVHAFAMLATRVPQTVPAVSVLQGKWQIFKAWRHVLIAYLANMQVSRQQLRVFSVETQEHFSVLRAAHRSQVANVMQGTKEVLAVGAWRGNSRVRRAVPPAPSARQASMLIALR